jgi:hypothetical protein
MPQVIRWRSPADDSLEHLVLHATASALHADSAVIAGPPEAPHALRYTLDLAPTWTVRALDVSLIGGPSLHLRTDARGRWTDFSGAPVPALDGCLDIDLAATPFTNTLPINRLRLAAGESRDLRVVYLPVPDLCPFPVTQRYTCLAPGRLYRYEGYPAGFVADLQVDADGLVIDYPGLFRRIR